MNRHAIGRASALSGVKVSTIRYYERIELMPPPERVESGRRTYADADVERLRFIRHARELGFPIEAIRELLELQGQPELGCAEVDAIARRQLAALELRILRLVALRGELERMLEGCRAGRVEACSILAVLADHALCEGEHGAPDADAVPAR